MNTLNHYFQDQDGLQRMGHSNVIGGDEKGGNSGIFMLPRKHVTTQGEASPKMHITPKGALRGVGGSGRLVGD